MGVFGQKFPSCSRCTAGGAPPPAGTRLCDGHFSRKNRGEGALPAKRHSRQYRIWGTAVHSPLPKIPTPTPLFFRGLRGVQILLLCYAGGDPRSTPRGYQLQTAALGVLAGPRSAAVHYLVHPLWKPLSHRNAAHTGRPPPPCLPPSMKCSHQNAMKNSQRVCR